MSSLVTVSQPASNEILVSSPYIQALGSVNRLGELQRELTTDSNSLIGDIFFKFYRCDDSSGTKVYSALDVSSAVAQSTLIDRFLTLLFSNYYQDSTLVDDIGGSFPDISERLSGATPTNSLASSLSMPASVSNYIEYVGLGISSYFGATYVNGGHPDQPTSVWGNRVGQVFVTDKDPLVAGEKMYDNSDSGCWTFSDYGCDGIIVYTNSMGGAWSAPGLNVWSQLFATQPILTHVLSADFACMFSTLDTSFLRNGLGYFDRSSRRDSFFGWAGNYLLSIFNDWGNPLVSPYWCMSDIGTAGSLTMGASDPSKNYGSISDPAKLFRFTGPTAQQNTYNVVEKSARLLLNLLWTNECMFGTVSAESSAVLNFQRDYTTLGYATGADYISAAIAGIPEGFNSHIYKYIAKEKIYPYYNPVNTKSYITNGVSWYGNLNKQPNLGDCFCDHQNGIPKIYGKAIDDFYGSAAGTYGDVLKTRYLTSMPLAIEEMSTKDVEDFEGWLYTP